MFQRNPTGTGNAVILRRAATQPVLHKALKVPLGAPREPSAGLPGAALWILLGGLVFLGLSADFTEEAWPLAILMVLPFAALAYDGWSRRRSRAPVRRETRIVADRRPVLLRPVLILPQGRPARLIAKLPRLLVQLPARPERRRGSIKGQLKARLLARRRDQ